MITRCICSDITFAELKDIADSTKSDSIDELKQHAQFGQNCKLCHPYVEKMLRTGDTEFEVILLER